MTWLWIVAGGFCGYLIGAVSPARIILRFKAPGEDPGRGTDVPLEGSEKTMRLHTVSASSVSVRLGSRYGFATYVLDMVKVFAPTLAARLLFPESRLFLAVAFGAMVGHVWPIYHRFRGGRGLSAVYGTLLAIDPPGIFATAIPGMLFGLVVLRDMLMAYLVGIVLVIPWLWFRTHDLYHLAYAVAVNLVFILAMIPEIRDWRRIKKEQGWNSTRRVMALSGMGRGLLKAARWARLIDDETTGRKRKDG